MRKLLDIKSAKQYKNNSQKIRVITELWTKENIFCPNCGNFIYEYPNNNPVGDFYCKKCSEDFELKSKRGKMGKKVGAGAYSKMVERVNSKNKPNFFFLSYIENYFVNDFFAVPKYFFIPDIIEKRKALSENAKRANWVGSNILFFKIPDAGKIYYVENGKEFSEKDILKKWHKTAFMKKITKADAKGWILDIMNCIESFGKKEFSLQDIYNFESNLKVLHPENKHIKPKIRQQLQFLRDKGYLKFLGDGKYKLT